MDGRAAVQPCTKALEIEIGDSDCSGMKAFIEKNLQ